MKRSNCIDWGLWRCKEWVDKKRMELKAKAGNKNKKEEERIFLGIRFIPLQNFKRLFTWRNHIYTTKLPLTNLIYHCYIVEQEPSINLMGEWRCNSRNSTNKAVKESAAQTFRENN